MHAAEPLCDYRYAPFDQLYLPSTSAWLSAAEQAAAARFRDSGRRRAWLAGRLLAKRLVCSRLAALGRDCPRSASQIEIRSAGHRPVMLLNGRRLPWSLSIAHTRRAVLAALSSAPGTRIGVDLVVPESYGRGFAATWFSPCERHAAERGACCSLATLWAVKEAAYKATGGARPFDPRAIEVDLAGQTAELSTANAVRVCRVIVWRTSLAEVAALAWRAWPAVVMTRGASSATECISPIPNP
jgi:4'-phosphopantetheinyl transferase